MTSKTAWLVLLSLLPLPAAAVGGDDDVLPSRQQLVREPSSKEEAATTAAMKSLTAEKLQKYVAYWKRVDTRGTQVREREGRKPVNAQGDLGAMFRNIRAESLAEVGLDRHALKEMNLAVKTYFDSLDSHERGGCGTQMTAAQRDASARRAAAAQAARKDDFVARSGEPAYTLLHGQEDALRATSDARYTYDN